MADAPVSAVRSPVPQPRDPEDADRSAGKKHGEIRGRRQELLRISQTNPAGGHFSGTCTRTYASLTTVVRDVQKDIVAGRKPISAYKEELRKWRSGGGDKMRAEYEASLAGN
ncbi:hypothetical protein [Streptomyces sp. NPDC088246]|uniref:hypothetical protein n=1 Tax=Streptomyces sp. NPDC088246 TaxID=3365842 RepID=UPI0038003024